ncbi:hypothetical protein [Pseudodesulfovibrio sediminis]|uniref:DUF2680 domain-containing protein n=1 Tax=Pseudodesulfovibrio sediminis TaxID=2810563 RepID=A0ABM7P4K2_9BACT|nr:hypothetical protein [Pseudodesulfovibrio sediminis]BCS87829.1 hypothetical protein PSDVSF_10710 [Pseudodesulfovibrio sediminis]
MKKILYTLLAVAFLTLAIPFSATAQDPAPAPSTTDALIDLVGQAVVDEVTTANEDVQKTKDVLDIVLKSGTKEEQDEARREVETAKGRYAEAVGKMDMAHVNAIAEECDKSPAEIQAMRNSGMGWGRIAKECGVHPSVSGKGKGKDKGKKKDKGNKDKGKKKKK